MRPSCGNFWDSYGLSINSAETELGCLCWKLCIKLYCGVYEMGNDNGIRFHKVEPRLDEWAGHGQPTAGFWDC